MLKYYTEADDDLDQLDDEWEDYKNFDFSVQCGPEKELTAVGTCNPIKEAKKSAESVPVAAKGCNEFYVDASDIATHAKLNEQTMLESLNDVISCNADYGMRASNIIVVVDESTVCYVRNLEKHGASCMCFVNESDNDIQMQVQVGPNDDELHVSADPQDANPVDAVKRQYDNVVVAKDDDNFFVDVEDVQKCADLNCESTIDTLREVISCNEHYGMTPYNTVVICDEGTDISSIIDMESAGVTIARDI